MMSSLAISESTRRSAASVLFSAGMKIVFRNEEYLIRTCEPDYFVIQHVRDHTIDMIDSITLSDAYANGELTLVTPEPTVAIHPISDPAKLAEAERILSYVEELDVNGKPGSEVERKRVIEYISKRIGDKSPPHQMQLYRYYKKWTQAGKSVSAFLKKTQTRRKPITGPQLDFAMHIIDREYLKPLGGNRSELYRVYILAFEEEKATNALKFNLEGNPMSKTSLDNILDSLDRFEVDICQKGLLRARDIHRNSNELIVADYFGQRIEVDAVHLNIGLRNEDGSYIGRVIVFFAIDVYSRAILGYSMVYGESPGESAQAVLELFKHVVTPKKHNGNFVNEWYTVPNIRHIHADNGAAFTSEMVVRAAHMINAKIHHSESRKSQRRPFIERFNRTLRGQFMTKLPGYLGKRMDDSNFGMTLEQTAVLTVSDFTRYLEEYIVDVYHQNPHKGLGGRTPAQVVEQADNTFFRAKLPNLARLESLMGAVKTRTIQATHGIQIDNIKFHSSELNQYRLQLSNSSKSSGAVKVEFIYNPSDISQITVLLPNFESLVVPNRDKRVEPGTSLAEYKAFLTAEMGNFEKATPKVFTSKHNSHPKPQKPKRKSNILKQPLIETHSTEPCTDEDLQALLNSGNQRFSKDLSQHKPIAVDADADVQLNKSPAKRKRSRAN